MSPTDDKESLPAPIHPALASALEAKGYNQLTPVQMEMATRSQLEADLLVSARTLSDILLLASFKSLHGSGLLVALSGDANMTTASPADADTAAEYLARGLFTLAV